MYRVVQQICVLHCQLLFQAQQHHACQHQWPPSLQRSKTLTRLEKVSKITICIEIYV